MFDHIDVAAAGTQVPAGGIKPGESPEAAVVRELAEEAGVTTARLVRKLGEAWWQTEPENVPAGLEEQVHHSFHLHVDDPGPDTYDWDDYDGGTAVVHRFRFRWVTLAEAATALWPAQQMWLASVRVSIEKGGY